MTRMIQLAALIAATQLMAGCASPSSAEQTAARVAEKEDCVRTLGSNICRKEGSGNPAGVSSVSGDSLRRAGQPLGGPRGSAILD
jgi:uncharacterized membrane protein